MARAAPTGFRWPVVLRLMLVCAFAFPLIGNPLRLTWSGQVFWVLMVGGWLALLVHTLHLAFARAQLRLDHESVTLVSTALFGSKTHVCALTELEVGAVAVLRSDEGEDAANTCCLRLHFGPELVQAFAAHDERDLQQLRSSLIDWLESNGPRGARRIEPAR